MRRRHQLKAVAALHREKAPSAEAFAPKPFHASEDNRSAADRHDWSSKLGRQTVS
jgi:hypothetical protein